MRYTLIVATFTLSALAVPLPEADPIFISNGKGCVGMSGGKCIKDGKREIGSPLEANIEARLPEPNAFDEKSSQGFGSNAKRAPSPFGRGSHPPRELEDEDENVEGRAIRNEGRSPALSRPKNTRAIRNEGKRSVREKTADGHVQGRAIRNEGRSPALSRPENTRAIRNEGKRSVREKTADADIEASAIRNEGRSPALGRPKNTRAIRNEGKRSVREKTVSEGDVEARAIRNEGRSPALGRPKNTRNEDQTDGEAMDPSGYTRGPDKREAEPVNRIFGESGATRTSKQAV